MAPPSSSPPGPDGDVVDVAALRETERRNRGCAACRLRAGCTAPVVADGDPLAPLVIVGEGPGREEDRTGRPFVGPAGELLGRILEAAGLRREEAYLTNIVKCRAPQRRPPLVDEVDTCTRLWLGPQLALLRPRVILALGGVATQHLLGTEQGVTRLRGLWFRVRPPGGSETLLMPLLHPAYLLRHPERTPGSPKSLTWRDIREVAAVLSGEQEPAQVRGLPDTVPGGLFGER